MADLLRVSIVGSMPNGEEWSVNPVYSVGGDFGTPVSPTQAQTIATAIAAITIPTALLTSLASACTYNGCRVEARSLDGTLESLAEAVKTVPPTGTSATPHPFQTSLVSSLRTGTPGPSGRGRLYWPATGIALLTTTMRPSSTTVSSFLSGVKTYLSGIETAIEASLTGVALAVWSRKVPELYVVNNIQAGDVMDVQRRRRDVLVEAYQSLSYP